jgi:predicted nucleic acid-binding protein
MRVIADASILIHLSAIGRFHLLRKFFEEVIIPEGVYAEVVVEGWGFSGSLETSEAIKDGVLKVKQVIDKEKVKEISKEYRISVSNAEVIQLAKEMNVEIVLANEEEVREIAEAAGFKVRGCLGILMDAVKNRLITPKQATQDIDNLVNSGYRISDEIIKIVKESLRRWE